MSAVLYTISETEASPDAVSTIVVIDPPSATAPDTPAPAHPEIQAYLDRLCANVPEEIKAQVRFVPCVEKVPWDIESNERLTGWNTSAALGAWGTVLATVADPANSTNRVGYVIGDRTVVLDVDHVSENPTIANDALASLLTYAERSMSGINLHLLGAGDRPNYVSSSALDIRYPGQLVVLTGDVIDDKHRGYRNITWEVNALAERYLSPAPVPSPPLDVPPPRPMSDAELIAVIERSKQAAKFRDLMETIPDERSTAGFALLRLLSFYTWDREQLARIFQRSAIYQTDNRPGKDAKYGPGRPGFLEEEIDKAISRCTSTYGHRSDILLNTQDSREQVERRSHVYAYADLATLPPPTWAIDGILPEHGIGIIGAEPGTGKTFTGLAISYAMTTATAFAGCEINRPGSVYYIAADGITGIYQRMAALEAAYGTTPERFYATDEPYLFTQPGDVDAILADVAELPQPVTLVVIDTLAATNDSDENDNSAMTAYMRNVKRIRDATGAAVLLIHHSPKSGDYLRGASSIKADIDVGIEAKAEGRTVTLLCQKMRHAAKFADLCFDLTPVPETGSAYLKAIGPLTVAFRKLTGSERIARDTLATFGPDGARHNQWRNGCKQRELSATGFNNALKSLQTANVVIKDESVNRYRLAPEFGNNGHRG